MTNIMNWIKANMTLVTVGGIAVVLFLFRGKLMPKKRVYRRRRATTSYRRRRAMR
jgi:hypothetical protein